jgi:hypothetical protein
MIPVISKGDLTQLSEKRQKKICSCNPVCKEFFIFTSDEDFTLCGNDAREFAFRILEVKGIVTQKREFPKSQYGWTILQERFVINYFKEENCIDEDGRVIRGTYRLIGEMLGKTKAAVKDKVNHLRRSGRI